MRSNTTTCSRSRVYARRRRARCWAGASAPEFWVDDGGAHTFGGPAFVTYLDSDFTRSPFARDVGATAAWTAIARASLRNVDARVAGAGVCTLVACALLLPPRGAVVACFATLLGYAGLLAAALVVGYAVVLAVCSVVTCCARAAALQVRVVVAVVEACPGACCTAALLAVVPACVDCGACATTVVMIVCTCGVASLVCCFLLCVGDAAAANAWHVCFYVRFCGYIVGMLLYACAFAADVVIATCWLAYMCVAAVAYFYCIAAAIVAASPATAALRTRTLVGAVALGVAAAMSCRTGGSHRYVAVAVVTAVAALLVVIAWARTLRCYWRRTPVASSAASGGAGGIAPSRVPPSTPSAAASGPGSRRRGVKMGSKPRVRTQATRTPEPAAGASAVYSIVRFVALFIVFPCVVSCLVAASQPVTGHDTGNCVVRGVAAQLGTTTPTMLATFDAAVAAAAATATTPPTAAERALDAAVRAGFNAACDAPTVYFGNEEMGHFARRLSLRVVHHDAFGAATAWGLVSSPLVLLHSLADNPNHVLPGDNDNLGGGGGVGSGSPADGEATGAAGVNFGGRKRAAEGSAGSLPPPPAQRHADGVAAATAVPEAVEAAAIQSSQAPTVAGLVTRFFVSYAVSAHRYIVTAVAASSAATKHVQFCWNLATAGRRDVVLAMLYPPAQSAAGDPFNNATFKHFRKHYGGDLAGFSIVDFVLTSSASTNAVIDLSKIDALAGNDDVVGDYGTRLVALLRAADANGTVVPVMYVAGSTIRKVFKKLVTRGTCVRRWVRSGVLGASVVSAIARTPIL